MSINGEPMEDEKRHLLAPKDGDEVFQNPACMLFLPHLAIKPSKEHLGLWQHARSMLREKMTPETVRVCIFFLLLVAFGIANSYSGRWNQLKFGNNYAFFNNQVCIPYLHLFLPNLNYSSQH
jgi:hypothetical protein